MVGSCHVIIDPCGDGRTRFAQAMASLAADEPVNEATVSEMLYAPADCEPDLIVVLGEPTRLPPLARVGTRIWRTRFPSDGME